MAGRAVRVSFIEESVVAARRAGKVVPTRAINLSARGITVRVTLAGSAVLPAIGDALLGGERAAANLDSEIHVFDSAESGVAPPPAPWPASAFMGAGEEIAGLTDPPRLATYNVDHATLSYYDETASAGVQWFRDARRMAPSEGGSPLRNLLRWAFGQHGAHMLHFAAVGGVLLGGPSGAGKSTTSLACAVAGLPFTSDDFTLTTLDGRPRAHAVYSRIKVFDSTLSLLPGLAQLGDPAGRDWRDKLRLDLSETIVREQRVHAIVLPALADATGTPRELAPSVALKQLTGSNWLAMNGAIARSITAVRALLEVLPAFTLPVGPDVANIPDAVEAAAAIGSSA